MTTTGGDESGSISGRVAVVTDSTCYLPQELQSKPDAIVPVHVILDGRSYREGVDISSAEVARALREGRSVGTSRVAPNAFLEVYRELADRGATGVVSIHLSGGLSGTVEAAQHAAEASPVPVTVVDSESVGMGMGFGVLDAVAMAAAGDSDLAAISEAVRRTTRSAHVIFYLDSLEQLRRGGRLGHAGAIVAQALRVKPLLHLDEGRVALLDKVRTAGKAINRLVEITVEDAEQWPQARLAIMHLDAEQRAREIGEKVRAALPQGELLNSEIGAVIGVHTGRGTVAVVVAPPPMGGVADASGQADTGRS